MIKIPHYDIKDKIMETPLWTFYTAKQLKSDTVFIIKTSVNSISEWIGNNRLEKEWTFLRANHHESALKGYSIGKYNHTVYMIMEYFHSKSLDTFIRKTEKMPIHTFLEIAITITQSISSLHYDDIIHLQLEPQHILLSQDNTAVKLTSFYKATNEGSMMHASLDDIEPNFALTPYLAPEQTVTNDQHLDYRTDLYALGATFYQMLTGQPPFCYTEDYQLKTQIQTKQPIPLQNLNPAVPDNISHIIMSLLEKSPDNRYQHSHQLIDDLSSIYQSQQLARTNNQRILLNIQSQKTPFLYGRDKEKKQIYDTYSRIVKDKSGILLLHGTSGIGKTTLFNHLYRRHMKDKGYFLKADCHESSAPYRPIINLFNDLFEQISNENEENVQKWKEELRGHFSPYSNLFSKLVTQSKPFLSTSTEQTTPSPKMNLAQFRQTIKDLVMLFTVARKPLYFFIDDLQWIDWESASLLIHMFHDPEIDQLILVGAYRDDDMHPAIQELLQKTTNNPNSTHSISIEPLTAFHVKNWIENQFQIHGKPLYELSQIIFRISQGNPFYIDQLLKTYQEEGVIFHDSLKDEWHINQKNYSTNPLNKSMIEVIQQRFNKLSEKTGELLRLASCRNIPFDSEKLALITGYASEEVKVELKIAINKGMIVEQQNEAVIHSNQNGSIIYRFIHDKIRQAVAHTLTTDQKEDYHLRTGEMYLQLCDKDNLHPYLYAVVGQFNRCLDKLSQSNKHSLVEWNLLAGNKAKKETAFSAALHYYEQGISILSSMLEDNPKLYYQLKLNVGETAYLNQQYNRAENVFQSILSSSAGKETKVKVYNMQILLYTHTQQTAKAVEAGLSAIRLYDVKLVPKPNKISVMKEFFKLKRTFQQDSHTLPRNLRELPLDNFNILMRSLTHVVAPAFLENQNLAAILILKAMRFSFIRKENEQYPIAYVNYALILSTGLHDYEHSYQYGALALERSQQSNNLLLQSTVHFTYAVFIHYLKKPLSEVPDQLRAAQQTAIQTGDLNQATAASSFIAAAALASGQHLSLIEEELEHQIEFVYHQFSRLPYDYLHEMLTWIRFLKSTDKNIIWSELPFVKEDASLIIHYTLRLQMTYLFKNDKEAIDIMHKIDKVPYNTLHLIVSPDCFLYLILWQTKMIRHKIKTPIKSKFKTKKLLDKLKKYAESAPINYRHKYHLAKAEWLAIKNESIEALRHYQLAVNASLDSGHLLDIALINECIGHFYMEKDLKEMALDYFHKACRCYRDAGANNLSEFIHVHFLKNSEKLVPPSKIKNNQQALNLEVLFEANYILANEKSPKEILTRLMSIIQQHTNADQILLLLKDQDHFQIAATTFKDKETNIYPSIFPPYPKEIIKYIADHLEVVLLNDAMHSGSFTNNQDIIKRKVKSLLALPIMYQGELTGVLYMENNSIKNAFNGDLILLLTLLSSQASITLVNERWYDELELKIEKRTTRLRQTNKTLSVEREQRRELLSKIAHDLRTPIAVVAGYMDIIFDNRLNNSEKQEKYIQTIKKRLKSMDRLLNDLMELASLEQRTDGKTGFQKEFIPADQLFKNISQKFAPKSQDKNCHYEWVLPEAEPIEYPLLEIDVNRMEQVIENLLNNAEQGENVTIRISLSLETEDTVILEIQDNGIGIPQSELSHIFDKYYSNRSEGHGLGLVICREIIKHHKGDIWVKSEFGEGTTVFVSLPIIDI